MQQATDAPVDTKTGEVLSAIRPFFETLRELREGKTLDELAIQLNAVMEGVLEHGKAGEVCLKIKIKPLGNQSISGAVVMIPKVTSVVPQAAVEGTLFFSDADHNPTRIQTRQPDLPGIRLAGEKEIA